MKRWADLRLRLNIFWKKLAREQHLTQQKDHHWYFNSKYLIDTLVWSLRCVWRNFSLSTAECLRRQMALLYWSIMPIDQEVSFPCLFLLATVQEDLGLRAYWISVARLLFNISLAGLIAGLPPSQREKKMIQWLSVVRHTHTNSKRGNGLTARSAHSLIFSPSDLVLFWCNKKWVHIMCNLCVWWRRWECVSIGDSSLLNQLAHSLPR